MGLRPTAGAYHKDEKQEAALHARVSQETFDAAVQENIDEFDMEPEEALADAIQQFETQGVNLSNVVKRPPRSPSCWRRSRASPSPTRSAPSSRSSTRCRWRSPSWAST